MKRKVYISADCDGIFLYDEKKVCHPILRDNQVSVEYIARGDMLSARRCESRFCDPYYEVLRLKLRREMIAPSYAFSRRRLIKISQECKIKLALPDAKMFEERDESTTAAEVEEPKTVKEEKDYDSAAKMIDDGKSYREVRRVLGITQDSYLRWDKRRKKYAERSALVLPLLGYHSIAEIIRITKVPRSAIREIIDDAHRRSSMGQPQIPRWLMAPREGENKEEFDRTFPPVMREGGSWGINEVTRRYEIKINGKVCSWWDEDLGEWKEKDASYHYGYYKFYLSPDLRWMICSSIAPEGFANHRLKREADAKAKKDAEERRIREIRARAEEEREREEDARYARLREDERRRAQRTMAQRARSNEAEERKIQSGVRTVIRENNKIERGAEKTKKEKEMAERRNAWAEKVYERRAERAAE